jgi:hypothetical protein
MIYSSCGVQRLKVKEVPNRRREMILASASQSKISQIPHLGNVLGQIQHARAMQVKHT